MHFFDMIGSEDFFKPLTSRHRRVYYDCMRLLIDRSKSLPVLYESTARDDINIYLNNKKYSGVDEDTGVALNGALILTRLRECAWLLPREIGRGGEYVVEIAGNARRVMDFFAKMTEKIDDGEMSNRIFSMYELLFHLREEDNVRRERPYTNILLPLLDDAVGLKNELSDLKEHIATIMKEVIRLQDLNSFGQFILKDEMLERFFKEYFFVKNNGMIPMQLSFIKEELYNLKIGVLYERMISECEDKLELDRSEAEAKVDAYYAEIQYFLNEEYMGNMDLIDQRINTYYRLANTRIALMASDGMHTETVIHELLMTLPELDSGEADEVLEKLSDAVMIRPHKYVGTKSFEKRRVIVRDTSNIGLKSSVMDEDEKAKRTEELFKRAPNKYSVKRAGEFLSGVLGDSEEFRLSDADVQEKSEALMYAASMMYGGSKEFPYDVEIGDSEVETSVGLISDLVIRRR